MSIQSLSDVRISRINVCRFTGVCCLLFLANDVVANYDGLTLLLFAQAVVTLCLMIAFFAAPVVRQDWLRPAIVVPSLLLTIFGIVNAQISSSGGSDVAGAHYMSPLQTTVATPYYSVVLVALSLSGLFDNIGQVNSQPRSSATVNLKKLGHLFACIIGLVGLFFVPYLRGEPLLPGAISLIVVASVYFGLVAIAKVDGDLVVRVSANREALTLPSATVKKIVSAAVLISLFVLFLFVCSAAGAAYWPAELLFFAALVYVVHPVYSSSAWSCTTSAEGIHLCSGSLSALFGVLCYAQMSGEAASAASVWQWCSAIALGGICVSAFGKNTPDLEVESLAVKYPTGVRSTPPEPSIFSTTLGRVGKFNFEPRASISVMKSVAQLVLADLGVVKDTAASDIARSTVDRL